MTLSIINPPDLPAPRGYSHGIEGKGRTLFVAGQIGWDAKMSMAPDFVTQFGQALDNVLSVVRAAGAGPADIADMTIFVTQLDAYRKSAKPLGTVWRARMGRNYPAMAVVGCPGLVHPDALVEIKATAMLFDPPDVPARRR